MSKAFFSAKGVGIDVFCDDCSCGCPPFEGRDIIYVDKHASGTGNGSSWANAYTNIQAAINAHSRKEIQIQGYGESDCYPAGIVLAECTYLKGIGDMWIDGENAYRIEGVSSVDYYFSIGQVPLLHNKKLEKINIKNCYYGFRYILGTFKNCITSLITRDGFAACHGVFENCHAFDIYRYGFSGLSHSTINQCSVKNSSYGFYGGNESQFTESEAEECHHTGFYGAIDGSGWIFNCTAKNCGVCGFHIDNATDCTFINTLEGFLGGGFNGRNHVRCTASSIPNVNGYYANGGFYSSGAVDCDASGFRHGFYYCREDIINCSAHGNGVCGFTKTQGTLINCNSYNNCLKLDGWMGGCDLSTCP